jgi:hypothetical protein
MCSARRRESLAMPARRVKARGNDGKTHQEKVKENRERTNEPKTRILAIKVSQNV